jgi:transposase
MRQRTVRIYDKEFKLNAINLYLTSGRSYEQVSNELGIPLGTLVTWIKSHKKDGQQTLPILRPRKDGSMWLPY